jgi:transcriptional regulator with XRE-family HTH domain
MLASQLGVTSATIGLLLKQKSLATPDVLRLIKILEYANLPLTILFPNIEANTHKLLESLENKPLSSAGFLLSLLTIGTNTNENTKPTN